MNLVVAVVVEDVVGGRGISGLCYFLAGCLDRALSYSGHSDPSPHGSNRSTFRHH